MNYRDWADRFYTKLEYFQMSLCITDTKLAKVMRVGRNTLWRWKKQRAIPSLPAVVNFCSFYHLDPEEWIDFDGTIDRDVRHEYRIVKRIHRFPY